MLTLLNSGSSLLGSIVRGGADEIKEKRRNNPRGHLLRSAYPPGPGEGTLGA